MSVSQRGRGVSSVVATILLVAVVVVLASTVSVVAFGFADDVARPGPVVGESTGTFVEQDGDTGGIVRLTHVAGDTIQVSDIEVAVDADCSGTTRRGRLVGLPATTGNDIDDDQIEGANIFDQRSLNRFGGGALLQRSYSAGDTIVFRIPASKCDIDDGATVGVRVVHTPTNAVVIDRELRA
jgi:flagellin-like protein